MKTDPNGYREPAYYGEVYRQPGHHYGKDPHHSPYAPMWAMAIELCRGRVLDVGCGPGQFAQMAAHHMTPKPGVSYAHGIDSSWDAIVMARERCKHALTGRHFTPCDAYAYLDDLPQAFDTVVLLEVLEHLRADVPLLTLIPKGTRVIYSVPNFLCEGHVRCFESEEDVLERYGALVTEDCVAEIHRGTATWWLVAGERT